MNKGIKRSELVNKIYGKLENGVLTTPAYLKNDPKFLRLVILLDKCTKQNDCFWFESKGGTRKSEVKCPQSVQCADFWDNLVCQSTPLSETRYNFLLEKLRGIILLEEAYYES